MSAVSKGFKFEVFVEKLLNECGLCAERTNKANTHDLENYKRGFDGGVDIIASYYSGPKYNKGYTFYIQCKCHNKDLIKSAIAEVHTGISVRHVKEWNCLPVVIASCDASQETIQYAADAEVELILSKDLEILQLAKATGKATYDNYGTLMKVLLYHFTKDEIFMQTLPDSFGVYREMTETEKLMEQFRQDFNNSQSHLDRAQRHERIIREEYQKALDIQKLSVYKVLQMVGNNIDCDNSKKKSAKESKTNKITDDSG